MQPGPRALATTRRCPAGGLLHFKATCDVCFWHLADIADAKFDVRFTFQSRHQSALSPRPLSANN